MRVPHCGHSLVSVIANSPVHWSSINNRSKERKRLQRIPRKRQSHGSTRMKHGHKIKPQRAQSTQRVKVSVLSVISVALYYPCLIRVYPWPHSNASNSSRISSSTEFPSFKVLA